MPCSIQIRSMNSFSKITSLSRSVCIERISLGFALHHKTINLHVGSNQDKNDKYSKACLLYVQKAEAA